MGTAQRAIARENRNGKETATPGPVRGNGCGRFPGGVTFRVWAPNADAVAVIGDFNGWGDDYDCLVKGGNGFWALHLDAAKIGDAYKFVIGSGGRKLFKNDPYALETDGKGNSVISDPKFEWRENGFEMADRNALILYQVHVGTFFGDYDQETGTFGQVCEKMRYLKALGINALELVPVSGFPGAAHWGYDPAHLSAIERTYGGPKVLADLVDTAHRPGIAVIMQVSSAHFDTSAQGLWRFDGVSENGKGGIYFYNDGRSRTPWGDARPDYGKQEVRKYIRDYVFLWLEKYRCDGIRVEATGFVRHTTGGSQGGRELEDGLWLLKEINGEIRSRFPQKLLLAEDLRADRSITRPVVDGGLAFDAQGRRVYAGRQERATAGP
jgi:1,4-alpha-glucan branching enzyme